MFLAQIRMDSCLLGVESGKKIAGSHKKVHTSHLVKLPNIPSLRRLPRIIVWGVWTYHNGARQPRRMQVIVAH